MTNPSEDVEQWRIKYDMLLDSATGLREAMKDIYNVSCFTPEIAPAGMLENFQRIVRDVSHKALIESISVSRIQYAADLEAGKREGGQS